MALALPTPVRAFLEAHHVLTLATQGPQGPWAAALFYALDGEDLVFLSAPASRHARELAAEPRCAATIQGQEMDWRRIQGIQIEGVAARLVGPQAEAARQVYEDRFAFIRPGAAADPVRQALARTSWFRLRILRLLWIDNASGLGGRQAFGGA